MRPVEQRGATTYTGSGCEPLPVVRGDMDGTPVLISEWELSAEEIAQVLQTGRIWLQVRGTAQPPVCLSTISPFEADPR